VDEQNPAPENARMVPIDILRGVAILWVVLFHLWGDLEFFPGVPREYYEQLTWQLKHGNGPWAIFTSFTDLLFRDGFQGVPLFMMISGVSLTIAAYRAGEGLNWPRFFFARFRKLLAPYWVGVALTYAVISAIAWRQATTGSGSFSGHFGHGVTISLHTIILIDGGVIWASIALVPRLFEDQWFFAPQLALWFVGLLAQYYLLFPLLFFAMRRVGVVAFLVLTFGATVMANWWIVHEYGALELRFFLVTGWAPFRLFEFTAGMAIGWLLVAPEARRVLACMRNPLVMFAALALGLAAHTTGDLLIGRWTADALTAGGGGIYLQSLALPLVTLGLALLVLPLLVKPPSRIDRSVPLRALTTVGVMSYALLIINDPMRLVASQLRVEAVPGAVWWTFLVAVYVPLSVGLAWPLAKVLGLLPRSAGRAEAPRADPTPARAVLAAPTEAAEAVI
jgi:peptidoglycan/LPS O-acetylase OafA/YrhL